MNTYSIILVMTLLSLNLIINRFIQQNQNLLKIDFRRNNYMSDIVYTIIGSITLIVAIAYLVLVCITIKKKEFDTAKNFKCLFAFCAVLCVLYFMQTVGGILLAQPIFYSSSDAIYTVLYGCGTVIYLKILKKEFKKDEKTEKDNNEEDK